MRKTGAAVTAFCTSERVLDKALEHISSRKNGVSTMKEALVTTHSLIREISAVTRTGGA
jgi:hypothetical protein